MRERRQPCTASVSASGPAIRRPLSRHPEGASGEPRAEHLCGMRSLSIAYEPSNRHKEVNESEVKGEVSGCAAAAGHVAWQR
jgi:hypothetical protein